jgi:hypothetical protein
VSWWATLLSVFGLLLLLFATGLPIFACFMLINVVAVLMLMGVAGLGLFVNSMLETTTTEALVAIPLYVLLGELLFRAGGVSVLYQSLNQLIGAIRGRLYVIAITLAGILGAISGSAMASVAMLVSHEYRRPRPITFAAHRGASALLEVCALSPARVANERPGEISPPDASRTRDRGGPEARSPRRLQTRQSNLPRRLAFVTSRAFAVTVDQAITNTHRRQGGQRRTSNTWRARLPDRFT